METKVCSKCKKEKSVDQFYREKRSKDGLNWQCKTCRYKTSLKSNIKNGRHSGRYKYYQYLHDQGLQKCHKCNVIKDFTQFVKNKNNPNGRDYLCKACQKEYRLQRKHGSAKN